MFAVVLHNIVTILQVIIFVNILLSLVPKFAETSVGLFIQRVAYVIQTPARRLFEMLGLGRGPIDWSPVMSIFLLNIAEGVILRALYG